MEAVKLGEIKKELSQRDPQELVELCLKISKYKKENKELLIYLLFEQDHESGYIIKVKEEIDLAFSEINKSSFYYAKKGVRKALRITQKHIKYSGIKTTEIELFAHFLTNFKFLSRYFPKSMVWEKLNETILKKIEKALQQLHPDLQHDYDDLLQSLVKK
ncbi:MAG: hypothetical protein K1X82_02760 [Bacteroidia bacterium]|nr:hypothetical protein [Bacteroidia bacterium]